MSSAVMSKPRRSFSENAQIWFHQNRFRVLGPLAFIIQVSLILGIRISGDEYTDSDIYEEIAFVSNVSISEPDVETTAQGPIEEAESIPDQEWVDPRIASAVNPYMEGATLPVDLNPSLRPEYTVEARRNGIQGTVTLELVIANTGEVLQVRLISPPLGHGLEQAAIATYRQKRFGPSMLNGEPITVKIIVPVQFRLH